MKEIIPDIYKIDKIIGNIVGLTEEDLLKIENRVSKLILERMEGAKSSAPETVKGDFSITIKPPSRKGRSKKLYDDKNKKLSDFF